MKVVRHIDGNPLNNDIANLSIESVAGKHTPGPWHWTWDGDGQPGRVGVVLPCEPVEHCGYDSHCIALTQPGKFDARANAARITQCVNAHDDLVTALRIHHEWCTKNQYGYSEHGDDRVAYRATVLALTKAGVQP